MSATSDWLTEDGVTCVVCPDCDFTFDGCHEDEGGGYSCPSCCEAQHMSLLKKLVALASKFGDGVSPECSQFNDELGALVAAGGFVDVLEHARPFVDPQGAEAVERMQREIGLALLPAIRKATLAMEALNDALLAGAVAVTQKGGEK